jgi:hypothetical protein
MNNFYGQIDTQLHDSSLFWSSPMMKSATTWPFKDFNGS